MSNPKKPLSTEERQAFAICAGNSDNCSMLVGFSPKLPESVQMSTDQLVEKIREAVITELAVREEIQKINGSEKTSVGYSKGYADNWDAVFGKKEDTGLPN